MLTLTPCVSPGFQGFSSGGRCCGTVPWYVGRLVGRYLVAVHLKHATNRLLFICANPRLQGCMSIACFECLPLPPRSLSRTGPAQPSSGGKGSPPVRRRAADGADDAATHFRVSRWAARLNCGLHEQSSLFFHLPSGWPAEF